MKKNYLISYTLKPPGQHHLGVHEYLKDKNPIKVDRATYLVHTDITPAVLADHLKQLTDAGDPIYIFKIDHAPWGRVSSEVEAWFVKHPSKQT